jgi:glycosyltransferase involved in cell wall biosynthesis
MLEGMAMARPLLTTQAPGCRATVQEGENGLLVPIKNAEALALAMLQLANLSPNALQNMGQKGRQLAQTQFSIEAVVAHYQQAIIALENAERPKSGHFR